MNQVPTCISDMARIKALLMFDLSPRDGDDGR